VRVGRKLQFGDCVFDPESREVRRRGETLDLSPKALDLLAALLERRPAVVRKTTLQDLLWPQTHVGPTSLPRLVNELRRALGDESGEPRYVRTVHRFGYAFCGTAVEIPTPSAPPAGCGLRWGGREFLLVEGENLIGRGRDCQVRIASPRVSRHHARIVVAGGVATAEDLRSKNGTFIDAKRLEGPAALKGGEQLCVGKAVLVFFSAPDAASTETGSVPGQPASGPRSAR